MSGYDFFDIDLHDGHKVVSFETVAFVQDADYSWGAEAILKRRADGALFYVTDGGCSCNSFGDYLTVADLKPIHSIDEGLRMAEDRPNLQKSYEQRKEVLR